MSTHDTHPSTSSGRTSTVPPDTDPSALWADAELAAPSAPTGAPPSVPSGAPPKESGAGRRPGRIVAAAAGGAVLLAAGVFGINALKSNDASTAAVVGQGTSASAPAIPGQGQAGAQGQTGTQPGPGGGNSSTQAIGAITSINGSSIVLQALDGTTTTVVTSSSTTFSGSSSLTVGQVVMATGTRNSDGTFTATAVSTPQFGGQNGGQPGAQPGGASTTSSAATTTT